MSAQILHALKDRMAALRMQLVATVICCALVALTIAALVFELPRWVAHVCTFWQGIMLVCGLPLIPATVRRMRFIRAEIEAPDDDGEEAPTALGDYPSLSWCLCTDMNCDCPRPGEPGYPEDVNR